MAIIRVPSPICAALVACVLAGGPAPAAGRAAAAPRAGFVALFDGRSTQGWHLYGRRGEPVAGWSVRDGALVRSGAGGDLVSDAQFGDFELRLEWKIAPGGNSGVFYRVRENDEPVYHSALEYQVLDDRRHPDARNGADRLAGALYGLYPPARAAARPAGQWNAARIVARGDRVEHWLNGVRVAAFEIGSRDWNARLARSKFKDWPGFAGARRGAIALQDHGDEVAYRRIEIRALDR
ncbi:DUF1080 domain-containing protein [Lysobacter yananisis]|uniref:DUF1080 domain-containing protein n=1 Tax=Lysobacter yananisis TaxID=1003114 RepID=A0ABY9PBA3_9GAMM|nr:DUF1080 domain-containing protein [Lysobacter yananisis]WMT04338.1 DUF1080 domain-containing protein [Lysobacter yananisis]